MANPTGTALRVVCACFSVFLLATIVGPAPAANAVSIAHLSAVRLGRNDGYDRLVLEFTDHVPGYKIDYLPLPVHADPSGNDIPLPGAKAALYVSLISATGAGWAETDRTYFGPSTVAADTAVITEAKAAGDFEAVLSWVAGVRSEAPFHATTLDGPPRLVIDVAH